MMQWRISVGFPAVVLCVETLCPCIVDSMESLRRPHRNAAILGLLQGVPQGLTFSDQKVFIAAAFDASSFWLVVCFGVFGPPVMMALSHFASRRKEPALLVRVKQYIDLPEMFFWGGISLGVLGIISLKSKNVEQGYSVCAFFIAAGIGFLIGGNLEKWLCRKRPIAT